VLARVVSQSTSAIATSGLEKSDAAGRMARRRGCLSRTLRSMEVHFTPDQEARLRQMATKAGTNPERLVKDVLVRYLDDEAQFLAAVEKGIAAAERGEFIEEEEMDTRVERMFTP
jgi:predicted transcriptional regulator